MDRLLARLERRFGNFVIPGLTIYLVGFMGLVLCLELGKPGLSAQFLIMDRGLILDGEFWRLFSYMVIPPSLSPFWGLFAISLYYTMGSSLESHWGSFKYQVFLLTGMLLTTTFSFGFNLPADNKYILLSLLLAFATYWPDFIINVFFFIPVKVKWLALLGALGLLAAVGTLPGAVKVMPLLAVGNYLVFFAKDLLDLARGQARMAQRSRSFDKFRRDSEEARPATRTCKTCGVTDADRTAEFRVCLCEKCQGKPTMFCLNHINNH